MSNLAVTSSNRAMVRPDWAKQWLSRDTMTAWLFILPSLIGFITLYRVPMVRGLLISCTSWDMLSAPTFVGADNYVKILQDPQFWRSLGVTGYYVLLNIPLQTALA